jgi:hypothetical protein
MESLPYVPGFRADEPGPLSRFLPPLEEGTVATWLSQHVPAASWLLDPFGFSPRLVVEAAQAGYRVLVTVNNPITQFVLEMAADPPSEGDFKAALAELVDTKKGDERLETHLQSLYLTRCENCGREIQAESFIWRKGDEVPYARIYECSECGDKGERLATQEDIDRARQIASADALHRSRALERVAASGDADRVHAQEAIQHYLPRPLYALSTLINRRDSLSLTPERQRALTALILVACDAGNTLWDHPSERLRPKLLNVPNQFREQNLWRILERGLAQWTKTDAGVPCVAWPNKIPGTSGICIYSGRLKDLAQEVKKEIPISAVIGSVPRPNQAFWTLSALWAGWLWGRPAVESYKAALRRRRYDWAWNATALNATFIHLFDLMALGTPFFGLLPEAEPAFLTSAMTAMSAAGFDLKGMALRTEYDPIQFVWERGEHPTREAEPPSMEALRTELEDYLVERGEPATYLHLHAAALRTLADSQAIKHKEQEFDVALRGTQSMIETALKADDRFVHYSTGEGVEAGLWGLRESRAVESLCDRVEAAAVNYLQKNPACSHLEIETELYRQFSGLLTPSKAMLYAVLNSYAAQADGAWRLRAEDVDAVRQQDLKKIISIIEATGGRLRYQTRRQEKWLIWENDRQPVHAFVVLASALVAETISGNPHSPDLSVLVVPGGRAALIAYKEQRDPVLAERMQAYRVARFRLWRALAEIPILTRETFEEQLSGDPIQRARDQMMMF